MPNLIDAVGTVVAAYVSNHQISREDLISLIEIVSDALSAAVAPPIETESRPALLMPIAKTITPDALISLEDGRAYKTLKRHLRRGD